jgi:hypothetical protein
MTQLDDYNTFNDYGHHPGGATRKYKDSSTSACNSGTSVGCAMVKSLSDLMRRPIDDWSAS